MEKPHPDVLLGVSETLLILLNYRVKGRHTESNAFRDEIGERFHSAIEYACSKLQCQSFHSRIMAVRTAILDEQVGNFLRKAPDGLILNLGAGVDPRCYRLDNGMAEVARQFVVTQLAQRAQSGRF